MFKEMLKTETTTNISVIAAALVNCFVAYAIKWEFSIYIATKLPQKLNSLLTRNQIMNIMFSPKPFINSFVGERDRDIERDWNIETEKRDIREKCLLVLWRLKDLIQ